MDWQEQAEEHRIQAMAARDIGDAGLGFTHLKNWWDKSEIARRANICRTLLYTDKAEHALMTWNLAARSQAFKWNNDYRTVSGIFDKWEVLALHDQETESVAHDHYGKRARNRVLRGLDKARRDHRRADRVQGRVRLYIAGTKTLDVFEEVVKQRKTEEKDRVKKRLMSTYKHASSARKKRQFFTALSRWQQSANESKACAQLAGDSRSSLDHRKQAEALETWLQQTQVHDETIDQAVQHYILSWLDRWTTFAAQEAQQEAQAWDAWGLDRQRTALKGWSIMSLQRGGQAHTASVAYQKHCRDRRHRALQLWKQLSDKAKGNEELDADLGFTPAPASLRSYRQSWRFFSDRSRGVGNMSSVMSTTDTPTRWTGQLSLVSSTMGQNPMPAVEEADERDVIKSPAGVAPDFDSPVRGRSDDNVFGGLASTTPMAPVPAHLHQGYGSEPSGGAKPPPWPRSAFKQRAQYVPSNLGPAGPQRLFPGSLQERSGKESKAKAPLAGTSSLFLSRAQMEPRGQSMKASPTAANALATTPRLSRTSRTFTSSSPRAQEMDIDEDPSGGEN
jgi:hypothetical protein